MQFTIWQDIITGVCRLHIKSNAVYVEIYIVTLTIGYLWILGISSCEYRSCEELWNENTISPADTKHSIYVIFMLEGYVKIMLDFMLECLVFLT